jgi:hypothetical protein
MVALLKDQTTMGEITFWVVDSDPSVGVSGFSPSVGDLLIVKDSAGTNSGIYIKKTASIVPLLDSSATIGGSLYSVTQDPTGFPVPADNATALLSFVNGTRTFSITPVGASFDVYVQGTKYTKTTESVVTSAVEGWHYIFYDLAGVLSETTTFSTDIITKYSYVCALYWDNVNAQTILLGDERHGLSMTGATHLFLHNTIKTEYQSGFTLSGFTLGNGALATDTQFGVDAGVFKDEDIIFSYAALTGPASIPIFYRTGSAVSPLWRRKTADTFPLLYSGSGGYTGASGRAAYNQNNAGTYQLTEVGELFCYNIHYYAVNDTTQKIIGILGDTTYSTALAASDAQDEEILRIDTVPFLEGIPIASVIFVTSSTYANTPKARIVVNNALMSYTPWQDKVIKGNDLLNFIQANTKFVLPVLNNIEIEFETNFSCESVGAAGTLVTATVGTGASAAIQTATPDFTTIPLQTGTTATGSALWLFANSILWTNARNTTRIIEFDWQAISTSSAAQRFTFRAGLMATSNFLADNTGIYLRAVDNVNSGNIQCVVRNGASETLINTTVPGGGVQRRVYIVITTLSTVVSVYFYINEVIQNSGGTAIITNIPANGAILRVGAGSQKSVGTTNVIVYNSYFRVSRTFIAGQRF